MAVSVQNPTAPNLEKTTVCLDALDRHRKHTDQKSIRKEEQDKKCFPVNVPRADPSHGECLVYTVTWGRVDDNTREPVDTTRCPVQRADTVENSYIGRHDPPPPVSRSSIFSPLLLVNVKGHENKSRVNAV
jgi:hypothetical protein